MSQSHLTQPQSLSTWEMCLAVPVSEQAGGASQQTQDRATVAAIQTRIKTRQPRTWSALHVKRKTGYGGAAAPTVTTPRGNPPSRWAPGGWNRFRGVRAGRWDE